MDFNTILSMASENQGLSHLPVKRYSLSVGPPKKDPKVKGVHSAAVQAFLKKQQNENKKKEIESKRKKEELLAKRVEMKSDRKARAMASRTKDNFRGYDGVPIVEPTKKRRSKQEMAQERRRNAEGHERSGIGDEEDYYEYSQTESEYEDDGEETERMTARIPDRTTVREPEKASKKPIAAKPAPPPMNFAELLKLAQKKQFEPVELKSMKKTEEKLRTAEELKEMEFLERKNKKYVQETGKEGKPERDSRSQVVSSSSKKSLPDKDVRSGKLLSSKSYAEKLPPNGVVSKKPKPPSSSERPCSSSIAKQSQGDRHRPGLIGSSKSSSGASSVKNSLKHSSNSHSSAKSSAPRPSSSGGQRSSTSSDLNQKKGNFPPSGKMVGAHVRPGSSSSSASARPGSSGLGRPASAGQVRPTSANGPTKSGGSGPPRPGSGAQARPGSNGPGNPGNGMRDRPRNGEPGRPGNNPQARPGSSGPGRPDCNPQGRTGINGQVRPGSYPQARPGSSGPGQYGNGKQDRPRNGEPGRPGSNPHARPGSSGQMRPGGVAPARPGSTVGSGPGRPQCTVVSETISTKDFVPANGVRLPRPHPGHRPMMRPPGPLLPPITSSYKRKFDDDEDEYDSEMEDFIDDEGGDQDEVSKHIREIFGYDRSKYKDESDYALRYMESSWKDQQKEEARSLKLAVLEDQEEMRREEEELKKRKAKKQKTR
ncbi:protein SPT2 homolog isoform X2 [Polyodon spathula]|uniref:protein SPT2 homolog isoform X2 n=1 Tax=Polyodon spathula TaxID=7913 RepID=UPI001B7D92E9|nr:protein SPT2 homolog isoform X2 [Polyodon spathula]